MKVELYALNTKIGEYELTGVAFEQDGVVVGTGTAEAMVEGYETVPAHDGNWYPRTDPENYLPAFAAVLSSHGVYSTAKLVAEPDE